MQLQTISKDDCDDTDELIILLTSKPKAKSACALKNVTVEHSIAVASVETVAHKAYPTHKSTLAGFFASESDNVPTIRLQEKPSDEPQSHRRVHNSAPLFLEVTGTSVVFDDIPTIHMEEESDNSNADVKPNILCQNQKPEIDIGMFIGSIELPSFPREEINAEQS